MTIDPSAYNITLSRTEIDGEKVFEARVAELPGIVGYGDSAGQAHAVAVEAIEKLQEMAAKDGETLPTPIKRDPECSGRITLRMSSALHRLAKLTAEAEDVTLNSLLCERLAVSLGMSVGQRTVSITKYSIESIRPFAYAYPNATATGGVLATVIAPEGERSHISTSALTTVSGFTGATTGRFLAVDFSSQETEPV
jgi:predicted HicB family RNase H-like nuclease